MRCILRETMNTTNSSRILPILLALPVIFLIFGIYQIKDKSITTNLTVSTTTPEDLPMITMDDISFTYPKEFHIATNSEQILVKSYIPPCDETFNYCLYYMGEKYTGTNFESAGIKILKRVDLKNKNSCITSSPYGQDSSFAPTASSTNTLYSTSVFSPIGDAGGGHYAKGKLYRLFIQKSETCYEFETRIGQSQFANYPKGSIQEFTIGDMKDMESLLRISLHSITLRGGVRVIFEK